MPAETRFNSIRNCLMVSAVFIAFSSTVPASQHIAPASKSHSLRSLTPVLKTHTSVQTDGQQYPLPTPEGRRISRSTVLAIDIDGTATEDSHPVLHAIPTMMPTAISEEIPEAESVTYARFR